MQESARGGETPSSLPLRLNWTGAAFFILSALLSSVQFTPLRDYFFGVKVKTKMRVRRITDPDEVKRIRSALPQQYLKKGVYQLPSGRFVSYEFGRFKILEPAELLLSTGKMYTVLLTFLVFLLVGGVVGFFGRRRLLREMGLAGLGAVVVLWLLWAWGVDWEVKKLFVETLHVQSDNVLMKMPPTLFLVTISIVCVMTGVAGAALGTFGAELVSGKLNCPYCDGAISVRPHRPLACPECGETLKAGRFRWAWIAPSVLVTSLLFYLAVTVLGVPLGFYFKCDFNNRSDDCREGLRVFKVARREGSSKVIVWRKKGEKRGDRGRGVVLHTWKYVLYLSLLFLFAPFFVAWRSKKGSLPSAGLTLVLNWVGATLTAMLFLDFAQFEGLFMNSLRIHVIAGVPWCLAVSLGALAQHRLVTA